MTEDPIRLRDDPSVPEALRDELNRAAAHPWVDYDVAAGLARLKAAVQGGGGGPPGEGGSPAPVTAPSKTGSSLASALGPGVQGVIVGALAGLAAVALWPLAVGGDGGAPLLLAPPAVASSFDHRPEPPLVDRAPVDPQDSKRTAVESTPATSGGSRPPASFAARSGAVVAPPQVDGAPATSDADRIAEEVLHMKELRERAGADPATALTLIDEGNRRFAGGHLGPEREAIAISALVRLGRRAEARVRAERFLLNYPRSPFVDRVRIDVGVDAVKKGTP
jgi:hypothetical protein